MAPEEVRSIAALDYRFHDPALRTAALTHPSARRAGEAPEYQRLEFLGDRVIGLVLAELVYRRFPGEPEGKLTRRHGALVRKEALARIARILDLGPAIIMAKGEEAAGGRDNESTLSDACEAVFGAIYADGGLAPAAELIRRLWQPLLEESESPPRDAKTTLQEWLQGQGKGLPVYRLEERSGPAHEPLFRVSVTTFGEEPATGSGRSKQEAEKAAAASLLARLSPGSMT